MRVCQLCSLSVRRLARHMKKAHREHSRVVESSESVENEKGAPLAAVSIGVPDGSAGKALQATIHSKGAPQPSTVKLSERGASANFSKALTVCPDCKQQVREDRLLKHRQKVHRIPVRVVRGFTRQARRTPSPVALGATAFFQDDQSRVERQLDATKDVGYPCRETGRYGSYPHMMILETKALRNGYAY